MAISNEEIGELLQRMADAIEMTGGNEYRVQNYRIAAESIEELSEDVSQMVDDEHIELTGIEGVGEELASRVREIVRTGTLEEMEELEAQLPDEVVQMLQMPGVGPERAQMIRGELEIEDLDDLREAAEEDRLTEVKGIGEKTQQKILDALGDQE